MDWYEWLLFLHVLGAFLLVGALMFYWGLVLVQYRDQRAGNIATLSNITRPADIAVGAGFVLTLVFGVWLAIYVDGYELWDGWIIAALVLWAIAGWAGQRSGVEFTTARDRVRALPPDEVVDYRGETRRGLMLHTVTTVAAVLLLADMIWKPGA